MNLVDRISDNLQSIRQRIAAAAARAGRDASEITLVAVTKYVGDEEIAALIASGCRDFGESRPQVLWRNAERFRDAAVRWHLIGHLQRNKVARTVPLAALIHAVDSDRLLVEIDGAAERLGIWAEVLLEVNVSGDATKHGVTPEGLADLLAVVANCRHVRVRGLMTMAALEGDADVARANFRRLREIRDQARGSTASKLQLDELSMGMSGDFEIAIEEGATMVRVGSALFEGLM